MLKLELYSLLKGLTINAVTHGDEGANDGFDSHMMGGMGMFWGQPIFLWLFMITIMVVIEAIIVYYVYNHATRNNVPNPELWALLVLFLPIIGLLIYLIVASSASQPAVTTIPQNATPTTATTATTPSLSQQPVKMQNTPRFCSNCGSQVDPTDVFCKNCGTRVL